MKKRKSIKGTAVFRACVVAVSVLFQAGWLLLAVVKLNAYYAWISLCTTLFSAVVVLKLYSKHTNAAMKMPWIMLIMAFPVMGLSMYLMFDMLGDPGVRKRLRSAGERIREARYFPKDTLQDLDRQDSGAAGCFRYLQTAVGAPVYRNTKVTYYAEAKDAFEAMKQALEQAQSYIFMEYFIVEDASAFQELQQILIRKRQEGVDIRFLYDDIGSVGYVNMLFAAKLNGAGIRCVPFNPAVPVLNLFMNHRDHRKIMVIDGKVGFTGGFNLADAYFDRERPFGKWKDTGVRLEGEAVCGLSATFLQLWSVVTRDKTDFDRYLLPQCSVSSDNYVQPFGDDPLSKERAAQNVYLNLIGQAAKSFYVMTPYLIIPDELSNALGLAAKRGVDVRIITPGIPDKKTVFAITRSYYGSLVDQGVRIFEYSPGFCHGKMFICDGKVAMVGTSNLDYRSLYHHFENNVLLYGGEAVEAVGRDFEGLFVQSREVTEDYRCDRGAMLKMWQCLLRLFAPLI